MRILVTGGAGFIGSHYVRTSLAGGFPGYTQHQLTVLDKLTYAGNRNNLPRRHERLTFVVGDVCDRTLLQELVPGHDAIVHFAAESHVDRSIVSAEAFVRSNVMGTEAVLAAAVAAGVDRVVVVSTDEVYGSIEEGEWTEASPLLPNSPYSASKAGGDLIARAYWRTHGLNVSVTRCGNNYGPYQHPEKFIARSVTNLLDGRPVPLYGDGRNIREWLHVDDHCQAIQLVLTKGRPGAVYNIGGEPMTNLDLANQLVMLCGAGPESIERVPDRKGHDLRYALDWTRIREELGYRPRWDLVNGLAETVDWYRRNRSWWEPLVYT